MLTSIILEYLHNIFLQYLREKLKCNYGASSFVHESLFNLLFCHTRSKKAMKIYLNSPFKILNIQLQNCRNNKFTTHGMLDKCNVADGA